jgi:thioredoxin reductase
VIVGPGDEIMSADFQGKRVALLGGGDNAFENYAFVKERGASKATIYARTLRAQKQFVDRVPASDIVVGASDVDPAARTVNGQAYDWILVLYGWQANIGFLGDLQLTRDDRGFVQTDIVDAQTNVPGVYAIGEVAQRMHPCVPTAMADGVVAAKAIEKILTSGQ